MKTRWLPRTSIPALLLALLTIPTAMAQTFTISGTVRDPGMAPVAGVDVELYDNEGKPVGGFPPTVTDLAGFYSLPGIPAGTWGVGFVPPSASNLLPKIILGVVVTGNVTVDATLVQGKVLSGFVRDSSGQGIYNIDLNVYDQTTDTTLDTPGDNTDLAGFYDVVVPDGTYRLRWRDVSGGRWVPVELSGVTITNDTTIDVTLASGYFVSGTVRDQGSTPVADADLDFIFQASGVVQVTPGDNTNVSGQYQVIVPAALYDINAAPPAGLNLLPSTKSGVMITKDTTVDFTLSTGLALSGLVRDPNSTAVAGADIDVRDAASGTKLDTPGDNTDATGFYDVFVPPGTYDIDYQPTLASGLAPRRLFGVVLTKDSVLNVTVPFGLVLSGVVQNHSALPVADIDLDVKFSSTGEIVPVTGDQTDIAGAFTMVVPVGTLDVEVEPPTARRLSPKLLRAVPFGKDTAIAVTLDTGLVISGVVRDSAGLPLAGVEVHPLLGADTVFTLGHTTGPAGTYQFLMAPGTYDMSFHPTPASGIGDSTLIGVVIARDTVINLTFASGSGGGSSRGDVNQDGSITSSDVIYMVNFVFKGGPPPQPDATEGDVNCDGNVTSSDIIFLVNYVFKGGPPPVCP